MKKRVVLSGYGCDFEPKHIFECGQCFRFKKETDGSYTLVAENKVINVLKKNSDIIFNNVSDEEFSDVWYNYFDLKTDYKKIKNELSKNDDYLKTATEYGSGIRILNQNLWECIISFIISANNNIPRIQGIVERLCERYGDKLSYNNSTYYTFPGAEKIRGDLSFLRAGYRDVYIENACMRAISGELDLKSLLKMETTDAQKCLLSVKGIGPKVADCILLFGLEKREVFPVDVWVKRSVETLYGEENGKNPRQFAKDRFGALAGYAQQYLFYAMRESAINVKGGIKDA